MSLNHYVEDNYKDYLDPYINSIKIDNQFEYKETEKANGDSLVLDSDLVAQWAPVSASTPYGNGIAVRLGSYRITSLQTAAPLVYVAPYSSIFSYVNGSSFVTINEVGTYLMCVNLAYTDNIIYPVKIRLQSATPPSATYIDIPGSIISSFPNTLVFSGNNASPYPQLNGCCSCTVANVTAAGTKIHLSVAGNNLTVDPSTSSLVILKL